MLDWTKIKNNPYIAGFDLIDYTASKPLRVKISKAQIEEVYSQKSKGKEKQVILYLEVNGKQMPKGLLMSRRNLKTLTLAFNFQKDVEKWIGKEFNLWQEIEKHFGIEGPVAKVGAIRN